MKKKFSAIAGFIIVMAVLAVYFLSNPDNLNKSADQTIGTNLSEVSESPASGEPSASVTSAEQSSAQASATQNNTTEQAASGNSGKAPISAEAGEGIIPDGYINAKVTRIVDGDTLEADYRGKEYKVRLLCIDTPETVKRGVDVQPYGKKAKDKLKSLVLYKQVKLVFEKDIDDRYDRLLAYIMLKGGTCVNSVLIEQGFARVDFVRPNTVHKDYFNKLQEKAISGKKGLWSLPVDKRPFVKNDKGYYVPHYIDSDAS